MTSTALLTTLGPLAGVIIGALLTSSRTDRAHRTDVRREVYAGFVVAAHALRRHLAEASEDTSNFGLPGPEVMQRGTELMDALDIAAAAVIVSGSKHASEFAFRVQTKARVAWLHALPIPVGPSSEVPPTWVVTRAPDRRHELVVAITAFTAAARADVSGRTPTWLRARRIRAVVDDLAPAANPQEAEPGGGTAPEGEPD